uniref:C2H2-type domain-containing protein n=1 Tax=Anopheles stephensi TaxID=30069 RepID=A0A182XX02_ANOST
MHPDSGHTTYELSNQTCRLCLGNKEEVAALDASLTENELTNVIEGMFKIDYKRIHLQDETSTSGKKYVSKEIEESMPAEYVIEELVVEKSQMEMLQPDMLHKEENAGADLIIKVEEQDEDEHGVQEELVYEEMTLSESDIDMDAIIEEEKDAMHDTSEVSIIEGHMVEQDEQEQTVSEGGDSEHHSDKLYETGDEEEDDGSPDDEGYFDETIIRCYICMACVESEGSLQEHLTTMHGNLLPFHCDKCLLQFHSIHEVNQHLITHVFPFVCLYCPRRYCKERLLRVHNKVCSSYRCVLCPAEFVIKAHLIAHKRQHTAELRSSNKCKHCGRSFKQVSKLRRHIQSGECSGAKSEPKPSPEASVNRSRIGRHLLVCQVCNRKFDNNSHLARHFERDHAEFRLPLFPCDVCPKKFTSFEKSIRHRAYHRRSTAKPKETKKGKESDTVCKICNKAFRVDHQLLRHLTEDHSLSLELFECEQCPRKFSTEFKLRKHQYNSHRDNKPMFVCSHCGQKFEKKLTLKDHETKHLGTPAYRSKVAH